MKIKKLLEKYPNGKCWLWDSVNECWRVIDLFNTSEKCISDRYSESMPLESIPLPEDND